MERGCWEIEEGQEDRRGEKLNHCKAHKVVDVGFRDPSTVSDSVFPSIRVGSAVCYCPLQCVWNGRSWVVFGTLV